MLREDPSARFEPGLLRCRFISGRRDFRPVSRMTYRAILRDQRDAPVPVAADDRRTWWMFRDRIFWEDDGLDPDEVMALALERERRRRRRLDHALDAMAAERGAGARRSRSPRSSGGRSSAATGAAASPAAATSCCSSTT